MNLLGYQINSGFLKSDPERVIVKTFSATEQQGAATSCRTVCLSDKIKPLINNSCFLLTGNPLETFKLLKSELADVFLGVIDEKEQFVLETDASNAALSATLKSK